jgi:hypothetical protein
VYTKATLGPYQRFEDVDLSSHRYCAVPVYLRDSVAVYCLQPDVAANLDAQATIHAENHPNVSVLYPKSLPYFSITIINNSPTAFCPLPAFSTV